jgi:nicotinate dehydrogenase subunit B
MVGTVVAHTVPCNYILMVTPIIVNGIARTITTGPDRSLLEMLRDELGVTGPKLGCGEGVCGACTVLLGQRSVTACTTPVGEAAGQHVRTVEGLAEDGMLHPVQQAWLEIGAMQCGYCTPGWLTATAALLIRTPRPDDAAIARTLAGNVCRCGMYPRIIRAVRRAADLLESPELLMPVPARPATGTRLGLMSAGPEDHQDAAAAIPVVRLGEEEGTKAAPPFRLVADGMLTIAAIGSRAGRPRGEDAAWVCVLADGSVIAFTGKVEAGQGTRTAITLLVAEELSVSPDVVRVVMGDTSVSPFDPGTFGSRSMARAAPPLRAAAAAARALLIADAAKRLDLPEASLDAADGVVMSRDGAAKVSYGDLLQGVRRIERVPRDQALKQAGSWQTAGCPHADIDGANIVTGRKQFPADLAVDGMLHGCMLRAPAMASRLSAADVSAARQIPGVTVVHDADFIGAVAADVSTARRAISAIDAVWETGAQPARPKLWAHLRSHPVSGQDAAAPVLFEQGDIGAALTAGPIRLKATYSAEYIAHVPLEPRSALAAWRDDELTVWTGTSMPFMARQGLAQCLGVPESRVRVIVPDYGGGFGGKHGWEVAAEAARLARAVDRPVKVQWTREEEFRCGYLRPAALIDVASSISGSGAITGWSFTNINAGSAGLLSPYNIPHQRVAYQPACSPMPQGAYRAMAATANHFARESHMDELAHSVGADPLELRLRHLDDSRLADVFCAAADRLGWARPCGNGAGAGIAGGYEKGGRVATAAAVTVDPDGRLTISRLITAFDCGAIVNPDNLTSQIEGAVIMGLGGALFEMIDFTQGRISNASMTAYRVPRLTDLPQIEVILLDRPDKPSAGGGETPMVAVAPAIANAIYDARRVRLRSMPLAPGGRVQS